MIGKNDKSIKDIRQFEHITIKAPEVILKTSNYHSLQKFFDQMIIIFFYIF